MIMFLDWISEWFLELTTTIIIVMIIIAVFSFGLMGYLIYKFSKKQQNEHLNCQNQGKYYSLTFGCIDKIKKIRSDGKCPDYYYKKGNECILDEESISMKDIETKKSRDHTRMHTM